MSLFHTDATQVPGKMKMDVKALDVDMLTLSAHKLHAPKGIGLLYVKRRTKFQPYLLGGHQEHGRRAGTENVASIVAFGRAAELALANLDDENTRVRALRDRMENAILTAIPNTVRNGAKEPRLPNTSNIAFDFVEAEAILLHARPDWRLRLQRFRLHHRLAGTVACPDRDGHQARPARAAASVSAWAFTTPPRKWTISCITFPRSSKNCARFLQRQPKPITSRLPIPKLRCNYEIQAQCCHRRRHRRRRRGDDQDAGEAQFSSRPIDLAGLGASAGKMLPFRGQGRFPSRN